MAVGYNELGREGEACQCFRQFAFLHSYGNTLVVEHVAQYLLLRQYQSALGGGAVNRRYEHYDVAGLNQIAKQLAFYLTRAQSSDSLLQLVDVTVGDGADKEALLSELHGLHSEQCLAHFV